MILIKYNNDVEFIKANASSKAKLVIDRIGGVLSLVQMYQNKEQFSQLNGVGPKLTLELRKICENLIKNNIPVSKVSEQSTKKQKLQILNMEYDHFKELLSVRARHLLNNIESLYDAAVPGRMKMAIIYDYVYRKIDLNKFQNLGDKTAKEINDFFKKVMNAYLNGHTIGTDKVSEGISKVNMAPQGRIKMYPALGELEISNIRTKNGKYNLLLGMVYYFKGIKKSSKTYTEVLKNYYFFDRLQNQTQIGISVNVTKERVRQIIVESGTKYFDYGFNFLFNKFKDDLIFEHGFVTENVAIIPLDKIYRSKITGYESVNSRFIRPISELYFSIQGYISVDKIIVEDPSKYKFFDTRNCLLFCKFDNTDEVAFSKFLKQLNMKFAEHFNSRIEFEIEDVISEACQELHLKSKHVAISLIKGLRAIVKDISNTSIERKHEKYKLQKRILDLLSEFMLDIGEGVTTEEMLKFLKKHKILYTKNQLIYLFNQHKDKISYTGLSGWMLNEQFNKKYKSPTIRQFVESYLKNHIEPVHISELLMAIGKFKRINENTLKVNLLSWKDSEIVGLNCDFFGIANRKYSLKWYKLPYVRRSIYLQVLNTKMSKKQLNITVENIEKQSGIPKVHLIYLYRKNHGMLDW
ncbi:MAG: hypothetical protein IPN13_10625 [Bacteroidetes bacterium]|nr:hypothetical protein [Bacteroidota bacterium]